MADETLRFINNPAYYNKEVATEDILVGTHVSGATGTDNKVTLGQLQCKPIFNCTTAAGTNAKEATIDASSMFAANFSIQRTFERSGETVTEYLVGLQVKVAFSFANTATDPTLNVGQTGALPIEVNGVRMHEGALAAGIYTFTLIREGTSYAWNCEDCGGIVKVKDGVITYSNGQTAYTESQVNSALSEYGKHIYTINRTISSTAFTVDLTDKVATRKNYRISVIGNYVTSIYYDGIFSVNFDTKKFNIIKISGVNIEITSTDQYKLTIKNTFTNATDFSVSITEC